MDAHVYILSCFAIRCFHSHAHTNFEKVQTIYYRLSPNLAEQCYEDRLRTCRLQTLEGRRKGAIQTFILVKGLEGGPRKSLVYIFPALFDYKICKNTLLLQIREKIKTYLKQLLIRGTLFSRA